ncbi:MAG TPA: magnesium transporter, partial [Thermoanaerobaculia bacterium]
MESGGGPQVLADAPRTVALSEELHRLSPIDGAQRLKRESDEVAARALALLSPGEAADMLEKLPGDRRERILAAAPGDRGQSWRIDLQYPETSVGRLMERPAAVFRPETTVAEAIERLRELVQ